MAEINPASWLQNGGSTHTAAQLRMGVGSLTSGNTTDLTTRGGVSPGVGGRLQVSQNGVGTLNVDVASGIVHVPGTLVGSQGVYICINDATVTLAIAAADGSNDRIDAVVATVRDSFYSGLDDDWVLEVITGTPAGVPVLPALPDNSFLLAEVLVQATVTQIFDADITDRRTYLGGLGPVSVADTTERDALETKYGGLAVWRRDISAVETYDEALSDWIRVSPLPPDRIIYTSSGTFVKANFPGAKKVLVQAQGSGQPGRGVGATSSGQAAYGHGGGGGGYAASLIDIDTLPTSVNVTVGAAQSGGVGTGLPGGGELSRFGDLTDDWRVQGDAASSSSSGMSSGTAPAIAGSGGTAGGTGDIVVGGASGDLGVRLDGSTGWGGRGADSPLGVGGQVRGVSTSASVGGQAGKGFGSGGSGAGNVGDQTANNGGDSAPGVVIVDVFYG